MKIRKMRRRRLKRSVVRRRRPYRRTSRRSSTEVKYIQQNLTSQAVFTDTGPLVGNVTLSTNCTITADLISQIGVGTALNQRIGNKIFVKHITCTFWFWLCPTLYSGAGSISINDGWLRILWMNNRTNTGLTDFGLFSQADKFLSIPNRKNYIVHYDKAFHLSTGFPITVTSPAPPTYQGVGDGVSRMVRFKMPVNRSVTFTQNVVPTVVKEDINVFSLSLIAGIPNMPFNASYQMLCCSGMYRVYFTDD